MRQKIRFVFLALVGQLWLFGGVPDAPAPRLADPLVGKQPTEQKAWMRNAASYATKPEVLEALRTGSFPVLTIPTAEGDFVFEQTRTRKRIQTTTWQGLDPESGATALLTIGDAGFFGHVLVDTHKYLLEPGPEAGTFLCFELSPEAIPPRIECVLDPDEQELAKLDLAPVSKRDGECDPGRQIDVMVLYTSGFAQLRGANAQTRIQYLIDVGNESYQNSAIETELNLVHAQEVAYPDYSPNAEDPEQSSINVALYDMTYLRGVHNPGLFDNVENLRTEHGADQVCLLRKFDNRGMQGNYFTCGLAWLVTSNNIQSGARNAYSVVEDGSFCTDDISYVHELGHNLGCDHDRFNGGGGGKYAYSNGWQDPQSKFVTVMGYDFNGYCPCGYIHHFSNPDISVQGSPTGAAPDAQYPADNARTINETRAIMAQYRIRNLGSRQPFIHVVPEIQLGSGENTRLGLVNPNDQTTGVEVFVFAANGEILGSSSLNLAARKKQIINVRTSFAGVVSRIGWLQIGSTRPLRVYAELTRDGVRSAYWASDALEVNVFVPHVAKNTTQFETMISSVNGTPLAANASIAPEPFGNTVELDGLECPYTQTTANAVDYFGGDIELVDWAEITASDFALAAMEYFSYLPDRKRIASLGLTGQMAHQLRFLHVAADVAQFWTGCVYMNVGNSTIQVTETYYDAEGNVLTADSVNLIRGEKRVVLFDVDNNSPEGTVWIDITSSTASLVGYELFGSANQSQHDFFAGLQGSYTTGRTLDYPHVESNETTWTGLVALNLGTQTANLTFQGIAENGTVVESVVVEGIAPKVKVVRTVSSLFSEGNRANIAWVRATTSASQWAGFALWGDLNTVRQNLAGLTAKVSP